jgi:hypothetical protein
MVIQGNCRTSENIMTALMSAAVRAGAGVVLIQEPSMKTEEDGWKAKIRDANFIYIQNVGDNKPYVLTAITKDMNWDDYGSMRRPERVGIEIWKTGIINIWRKNQVSEVLSGKYWTAI